MNLFARASRCLNELLIHIIGIDTQEVDVQPSNVSHRHGDNQTNFEVSVKLLRLWQCFGIEEVISGQRFSASAAGQAI